MKLILILILIPFISFSQTERDDLLEIATPVIEQHYIYKAKENGYTLRVENGFFRCTCNISDGIYFDEKEQEECLHSLNRNSIYFPEKPITKVDIDNDGDNDIKLNYTLESTGTIFSNYDCILINENGKYKVTFLNE